MRRRPFLVLSLAALVVVFASVNAIAGVVLRGVRLDLTEGRVYSTSDTLDAVVADFAEPVTLTLFYSRALAQDYSEIRTYGTRVRELLRGVADRSHGLVRLEVIDPEPFSEAEDRAIAAGVRGAATDAGDTLYFGLEARSSLDERGVIVFFNPENEPFLEYDVARLLADLKRDRAPKIALVTSLPLERVEASAFGGPMTPHPLYLYEQMLRNYDVETLDRDFTELPDDADVLVVAHPWPLEPEQLYAVDQFVVAKGRALIIVDPYARLTQEPGPTGFPDPDAVRASALEPLFAAWGVVYDPTSVVLDRANARLAGVREEGGRVVERAYPLWFTPPPEAMSDEDLTTAALSKGVTFASAGALEAAGGATTRFEPLIRTSEDSRRIDVTDAVDADPRDLAEAFEPEGAFVVAARVSGRVTSAYVDGPPDDVAAAPLPVEEGDAEIILVADADFWDDTYYVQRDPLFGDVPHGDNAAFVLNALDLLSGSYVLVRARSRGRLEHPLTRIEQMRADAESRFYAEQETLQTELAASEQRLADLEGAAGGAGALGDVDAASGAAQTELEAAREAIIEARGRLRAIQRSYRADIERLEAWVIFANMWLVPLLVAAVGVAVFAARRRRAGGAA